MIVRFEKGSALDQFGFDLRSDRVIRFDKKSTGTYMNTRATYTLNEAVYSHLFLRTKAIEIQTGTKAPAQKKNYIIAGIVVVVLLSSLLSECSTNFNVEVNSTVVESK
jgi:hypothetical protein